MKKENSPNTGTAPQTTTARRELFGWWSAMTWTILMMWGYEIFIKGDIRYVNGSVFEALFMLIQAVSITIFS